MVVCNDETSKKQITDKGRNFELSSGIHREILTLVYALPIVVPILMCYLSDLEEEIRLEYDFIYYQLVKRKTDYLEYLFVSPTKTPLSETFVKISFEKSLT